MSEFAVRVVRIGAPVVDHPNADRLSLISIGGYTCIAAKSEDGSHRYREGDLVVYVPEGAVVPEYLLKREGFWSERDGKGALAGSKGDRVKAKKLRDIFSQGILLPVHLKLPGEGGPMLPGLVHYVLNQDGERGFVSEGDDLAKTLGIKKWEPVIPASMAGEVVHVPGAAVKFDFESIQRVTDLFAEGEEVEATEKLHGTHFAFSYTPGLGHSDLFFGGDVACWSKGLGSKDLVFRDNEANDRNVYVRVLRKMLTDGLGSKLQDIARYLPNASKYTVFGEIFGNGVQDLSYGQTEPVFRAFDFMADDVFFPPEAARALFNYLDIEEVPILYRGAFDLNILVKFRDGPDFTGSHIREGIVIRGVEDSAHHHGRKIGKWVSPAYLLRKNGTEFQ